MLEELMVERLMAEGVTECSLGVGVHSWGRTRDLRKLAFHNYHRKTWPLLPRRIIFMQEYHSFDSPQ